MTPEETIRAFLAAAGHPPGERERAEARIEARVAWVRETLDAWRAAHRRVAEAWNRIFDALPDDLSDEEVEAIPPPPEQAELDALHAQIEAVRDHDKWPRELYWSL